MASLQRKIQRQHSMGNQPKVRQLKRYGQVLSYKHGTTGHSGPPVPGAAAPTTGSTSEQAANTPVNPAPSAPSAPQGPEPDSTNLTPNLNVTSYNPASGQPDPRDSQYWADFAALQAQTQQDYAGKQLEQSSSDTAFNLGTSQDAETNRRNIRNRAEGLIGTGLLRSGYHNRGQVEGQIDYGNLRAGKMQEKTSGDAMRKAQMQAILSNLGIGEMGLYSSASGRYADQQASSAQTATPFVEQVPDPNSLPGGPPRKPKRKKKK